MSYSSYFRRSAPSLNRRVKSLWKCCQPLPRSPAGAPKLQRVSFLHEAYTYLLTIRIELSCAYDLCGATV